MDDLFMWIGVLMFVFILGSIIVSNHNFRTECRELGGVPVIDSWGGRNICYPKGTIIDMRYN